MGFMKKMQGSYPATQNRISQQQHGRPQQQQGVDPPPLPNRVYQANGMAVAPATATATAHVATATAYSSSSQPVTAAHVTPAYTSAQPVVATAFVPTSSSPAAAVTAHAFVPGQQSTTTAFATAPTVDSLPPPVAPPYNPASSATTASSSTSSYGESKFWECSKCTFPNLRSEPKCKGCGNSIPSGLYQPAAAPSSSAASQHNAQHVVPQSPTPSVYHQPTTTSHATTTPATLNQQMNHMTISNNKSNNTANTMRVPVPHGMAPGQKIKVRSPDGQEVIKVIPPRNEWMRDEHNGSIFFRMTYGTSNNNAVVAGSAVTNTTTHGPPPPYSTTWRDFHPRASSAYSPPPIGMRSVPHSINPITPNGRHKSLLIGINYTGTRAALKGCHNDAKNMQKLLLSNGFPNDGSHMLLLTDERSRGKEYQPTASTILKAFQWFLKDVQTGDVLFFHFSGHGGQVPDKTGMESDGYNETLVPLDYDRAGQISDDVLWGSLVYPLPEGVRLTALMDMCHSGTGLDLPYDYNVDTRRWSTDVNPAHSKGDVVLFSGCEDAQTSADVQSGYQAGGAMTMAFTKAYLQCPMATYHEFLRVVKQELRRKGMRQRPQLTSSQRFDADSRIFSFGHMGGGGIPTMIESNHNPSIGRQKNRHVRPARQGFNRGGGNDLFAMAATGAGALLFANALGNLFDA